MKSFMFTDIESSTRLWEEHPEEMTSSLRLHDEILVRSVGDCGGAVLKTTGDGIVAVFATVGEATAAAVRAQRELAGRDWVDLVALKVRVGLHAGDAESRDGDFFGPVMNRTARIMAAAHGGETLASEAMAELLRDAPVPGVILRDLGHHRLKDLSLPEHLYQVVEEAHPVEFPPPVTLDSRPNNLPQQATEFLGGTTS